LTDRRFEGFWSIKPITVGGLGSVLGPEQRLLSLLALGDVHMGADYAFGAAVSILLNHLAASKNRRPLA